MYMGGETAGSYIASCSTIGAYTKSLAEETEDDIVLKRFPMEGDQPRSNRSKICFFASGCQRLFQQSEATGGEHQGLNSTGDLLLKELRKVAK